MIEEITRPHLDSLDDILELYRRAKNRSENYFFDHTWIEAVRARLKQDGFSGIVSRDNGAISGIALYQSGPETVYVHLIFVRRGEMRTRIFRELVNAIRDRHSRKLIMIAEPAPDFRIEDQIRLFSECAFEVRQRFEMTRGITIQKLGTARPQGFQIKKYKSAYLKELNKLDREAYRGEADELLFRVNNDISNSTPASKIVGSALGRFDKSLSEFIFRDKALAGAVYCVARGSDVLVANIATACKYRKMGLATLLLSRVLNRMGEQGYSGCRLFVSAENQKAINLYKKFNFKVERIRIYCVYRLGQGD